MDSSSSITTGAKFSDPWYSIPGVVYFISAGSGCETCKSVKIGVTTRAGLLRRLRAIQSSNHTRIHLLRIIELPGMREAELREIEIHKHFERLSRSPLGSVGSEWFTATPELMAYIDKEGTPLTQAAEPLPNAEIIARLFVED